MNRFDGYPRALIVAAASAAVLIVLLAGLVVFLLFRLDDDEQPGVLPSPTAVVALASPSATPGGDRGTVVASPGPATPSPTTAAAATATSVPSGQPAVHVVAAGESLATIAARYGVPADLIQAANKLEGTAAPVAGTQLFIPGSDGRLPASSPNQAVHRVGSGESLGAISVAYDISAQSIALANNLPNINHIEVGWILVIPREEITQAGGTAGTPTVPDDQATSYTVAPGDSLDSIARRFGVTPQALQEANGITDPNHIEVGQVLKIPR